MDNKSDNKNNKFNITKEFWQLAMYVVILVVICTCFIKAIASWSSTIKILKDFLKVISPFLIGLFIAFIINPFVKVIYHKLFTQVIPIKKEKLKLCLSIIISYLIVIGIIVLTVVYLIPQITKSAMDLADSIQHFGPTLAKWVEEIQERFPAIDLNSLDATIDKALPSISSLLQNIVTKLVPGIYVVGRSIVSGTINLLIAIMVSCYMLIDKKRLYVNIKRIIFAFMPVTRAESLIRTMRECSNIFTGFVVGKTIDSLIIGMICFIVMSILNMPYSLIISLIVGVTNMIPYFGPFIGAVPGTLILVMVSPKSALEFVIMIIVLQQFDGLFLGPKILGDSTGLRPLWIIFAITIGGWVAGPVGMFLGVPVVAVVAYLVEKMIDTKLAKKGIVLPKTEQEEEQKIKTGKKEESKREGSEKEQDNEE